MQFQSSSRDLPLKKSFAKARNNEKGLESYISSADTYFFDLPMQITNNPFASSQSNADNRPLYTKNNQSLSKFAVTQISCKEEQEEGGSITPICQKLFQDDIYSRIQKQFQLPKTLPSEELITQATFKPNELKQYLRNQNRGNQKLKIFLQSNVVNRGQSLNKISHLINLPRQSRDKVKTKYERILQECYNKQEKSKNLTKLNLEKINKHKQRRDEDIYQRKKINTQYGEQLDKMLKLKQCQSERIITLKDKESRRQMKPMKKTFSQSNIKQNIPDDKGLQRQPSNHWMKMNFQQRQSKTLENRKTKESKGQQSNLEKEVKNCTFKPSINVNDIRKRFEEKSAGSYAKLYFQKIKRRI